MAGECMLPNCREHGILIDCNRCERSLRSDARPQIGRKPRKRSRPEMNCQSDRNGKNPLRQHRTIASASLRRLFAPLLQFEKPEIHTGFLRFPNFELAQKSCLRLLAELRGAALRQHRIHMPARRQAGRAIFARRGRNPTDFRAKPGRTSFPGPMQRGDSARGIPFGPLPRNDR